MLQVCTCILSITLCEQLQLTMPSISAHLGLLQM